MKLYSGKRIGQSGSELMPAIVFSFFLHALVVLASVFLYISGTPKAYVPPFYQVKLVGQPVDLSQATPGETIPAPPKKEPMPKKTKASQKTKKAALKASKAAAKKGALPDLSHQKPKQTTEPTKPAETQEEQQASGRSAVKTENVAVTTPQQDFKFSWYLALVRDKIGQNWRPPPDAKDAKVRVIFAINRSGWITDVNLDSEHSIGTFGFQQAAIRAIRSSNPFPPLAEEFPKQSLELSVDLMAE